MIRPIGREPAATYWRRRALLLVAVLAMLFAVSRACAGDASGADGARRRGTGESISGPTAAEPTPTSTPTRGPGVGPTGGPGDGTGQPTTGPSEGVVAGGGVVPGYCQDVNLRLSIEPDKNTYKPDEQPRFTVQILNVGAGACRFEVGPKGWSVTVMSGQTRIWNSDDCAKTEESLLRTLQPIDPYPVTITWDRVRSKKDCPPDQPLAAPGTYSVVANAGAVESAKAIFILES